MAKGQGSGETTGDDVAVGSAVAVVFTVAMCICGVPMIIAGVILLHSEFLYVQPVSVGSSGSVYIRSFPLLFFNLQTKTDSFFAFENEKGIRFSFANVKTKKEKTVYTRTVVVKQLGCWTVGRRNQGSNCGIGRGPVF